MDTNFPEIPEYIRKMMESGEELDEIRIDADGNWFHNGVAFKNKKLITFFNKSIDLTKDKLYVVSYSGFVYPIIVEDVPLFVTGIRFAKDGDADCVYLALTSGETEKLDIDTLYYKNNALYCLVKKGKFPAKFKRSPCYEILQNIKDTDDIYFLEICGKRIVLSEKMDAHD
ncbi:MAG: hypothetical protein V1874_14700 [Spirochaetota bacterium]